MDTQTAAIDMQQIPFQLIANAGAARSMAFEALAAAKKGDFERADELMAQSREAALAAHQTQTDLLSAEAQAQEDGGSHLPVDVMLVHSQDHLMCAMLAQELIAEIIELYRTG